ncbi:hypothetical protein B30_07286 [Celeribacter baekdonensis B30]|uniref:Surface lipoprotein assembly modifier C-terminal domain-containing protein n=2 Tax=Celeribacter baekdonensis TaxID=875171 RepID=K2JDL4_9RHOB|nr:hypothetical protein B30_07286 [Celeribacter baekdonensis B30]
MRLMPYHARLARRPRLFAACVMAFALPLLPLPAHALEPQEVIANLARAQADARTGKKENAYDRLRWLLFTDTDHPSHSLTYQKALAKLRDGKPLTFGTSAALAPSTNLKRASSKSYFYTDGDTYYLGDSGKDHSGLGLNLTLSTSAARAYQPGREVSIGVDLGGNLYSDRDLSSAFLRLRVGHEWYDTGATYAFSLFRDMAQYSEHDGDPSLDWTAFGLSLSAARKLASGDTLRGSFTASDRNSDEAYYAYRDGLTTALSVGYTHPLSRKSQITVQGTLEQADLTRESLSYRSIKLGARYGRTTASGLSWELGAAATLRSYDDTFTALSYAREDQVNEVSLGLSHAKLKLRDTSPMLSCTLRDHGSNVALYDYNAVDCALSFRRDF